MSVVYSNFQFVRLNFPFIYFRNLIPRESIFLHNIDSMIKVTASNFVYFSFFLSLLVSVLTKRQQINRKQKTFISQLDFHKNHFYLYSQPLLNYIREEKFEIQIWLSENHVYDYSKSISNQIDKYLGSSYIDLHVLLTQKDIHLILPIFKQGTKDLSEATVEIQLTMDKSSDIQVKKNNQHIQIDLHFQFHLECRTRLRTKSSHADNSKLFK